MLSLRFLTALANLRLVVLLIPVFSPLCANCKAFKEACDFLKAILSIPLTLVSSKRILFSLNYFELVSVSHLSKKLLNAQNKGQFL